MARRPPTTVPPARHADLSPGQIEQALGRLDRRIGDLKAFDVNIISGGGDPKLRALERSIDDTLTKIFGSDTIEYRRYRSAAQLDYRPISIISTGSAYRTPASDIRHAVTRQISSAIETLQGVSRTLAEDLAEMAPISIAPSFPETEATPEKIEPRSNRVFVVHGHDNEAREITARFLERLDLEAIILHEQPNGGRTIIEKFEAHGGTSAFAVVLITPDDVGGPAGTPFDKLQPRARQNVVAELFYFIGRLGRARVCALVKGHVEIPSDLAGVVYTPMDTAGAWRFALAREMADAGLPIDPSKLMRA